MDTTANLFIRACKSRSPWKRVDRVYRKFYYSITDERAIAAILLQICEKHAPISAKELADDLNPANKWKFANDEDSYYKTLANVLISHLRLVRVDKINDYIVPCRFKAPANTVAHNENSLS